MSTIITDTQLDNFAALVQKMISDYMAVQFPNLTPPTITVEKGRSFAKIVKTEGGGTSVWGFVAIKDVKTKSITANAGDILKAATWKQPAKYARGNILNSNPLQGCNPYGPNYLA